jgi:tetratricopeptide (TPR) repeat protein
MTKPPTLPPTLPPGVKPIPAEPIIPVPANRKQKLSLQQAMALATQQQAAGNLDQAKTILQQLLQAQPEHDLALHLRGVVAQQQGDTKMALELIGRAIAINPGVSLYHSNLAEMYRLNGQHEEAIAHGKLAVRLDPDAAAAHSNLGIAWFDIDDLDAAEACQQRALQLLPGFAAALNNLGSIQRARKDKAGAIARYRQILALQPQHLEALNNLGAVLTEDEQYEEAVTTLRTALQLKPTYAEAHSNLGNAFVAMEEYDKATAAYSEALRLRPEYAEAYQGLARVWQEQDRLEEAEAAAEKALELSPQKPEIIALLASIYTNQGCTDKAMQAYDEALALDDSLLRAHIGKGTLLMEIGQLEAAEQSHLRALAIDPDSLPARVALTQVRKTRVGDSNLAELEKTAQDIDGMSRNKAMSLHFALGKCYDDTGDSDKAFPHFLAACRLKRSQIQYQRADTESLVSQLIAFFDAGRIRQLGGGGHGSTVPVFVLGMPRSGTTLTEQIIASHPEVFGAGELPDLLAVAHSTDVPDQNLYYPRSLADCDSNDMTRLGRQYVDGLLQRSSGSSRITDKMPSNFFAVGLIHLMLPRAKIIHIMRNPVDTCISGFSKMYNRGQLYSYDLGELGHYYRQYARLMDHWRHVLPAGSMLELQYEDLVANSEAQARRLIDYCELEWNDICLDFHNTKRSIRTASVTQVRQPIYQSSVLRWKRYEQYLQPLLEELGPDLVNGR